MALGHRVLAVRYNSGTVLAETEKPDCAPCWFEDRALLCSLGFMPGTDRFSAEAPA
jgi:hypothetical protein